MTHGRRGRGWEARLKVWHDTYRRQGVAWVVHTSPGMKRVGDGSGGDRFEAVFSSKGPPDFVGVALGRPVVFDAKESSDARWSPGRITEHQAADLDAATQAGAFAFVALRLGVTCAAGGGREWVVPWSELRPRWQAGGSLGVDELRELGQPMGTDGWLSALRALGSVAA